jgi:hypothetical protein
MRSIHILLGLLLANGRPALAAEAEVPTALVDVADPPRGRVELHGGLGVRNDRFIADGARTNAKGGAISDVALGGAWFAPGAAYGFAGRLALERFSVRDEDPARTGTLALTGFEMGAGIAGRIASGSLMLEGQLGYGLVQAPQARADAAALRPIALRAHGPIAGLALSGAPTAWLALEATARAMPFGLGATYEGRSVSLRRLAVGGAASVGRYERSGMRFSGLLRYELGTTSGGASGVEVAQARHQLGLGVRATFLPPPRPQERRAPPPAAPVFGEVIGVVRAQGPNGAPGPVLGGVTVDVAGRPPLRTGADGRFVLKELRPGLVTLRFAKSGHVDADEVVSVVAGAEVKLEIGLRRAGPAPAAVLGLVRAESGGPVAARVRLLELSLTVQADGEGHFRFDIAPGRYTLVIEAPGFVVQRKAVEVRPGEHNIYDVDLQRAP